MLELATWLLFAVSVTGVVLNIRHSPWSFACWTVSGVGWFAVAAIVWLPAMMAREALFFVLAVVGWVAWTRGRATCKECERLKVALARKTKLLDEADGITAALDDLNDRLMDEVNKTHDLNCRIQAMNDRLVEQLDETTDEVKRLAAENRRLMIERN